MKSDRSPALNIYRACCEPELKIELTPWLSVLTVAFGGVSGPRS